MLLIIAAEVPLQPVAIDSSLHLSGAVVFLNPVLRSFSLVAFGKLSGCQFSNGKS
jgi:hypothetical protein